MIKTSVSMDQCLIDTFSMDFFSLRGKTAIVTGGNSGLGLAFSMALAKAGANILMPSFVQDHGKAVTMIESQGVRGAFMQADVTQPGVPEAIVKTCMDTFGAVDILVNNAGISRLNCVLEFCRADWDPMVAVNLTAAFEMSREAAKIMVPRKTGKIINICSLFSYLGGLGSPAYAATKHGIAGLTKAYCDELAQFNIQVNGIAPGYFATALTTVTRSDPDLNRKVLEHIPAERWGELQDLMGTVVFLASRASDYVNGHVLVVDGGYRVR